MPKRHQPRHGSMQYWPRKRAKTQSTRVRSWTEVGEAKPLGFAGYKVGMTHVVVTDARKTSLTKGTDVTYPATIVECPPIRVAGIRFYKSIDNNKVAFTDVLSHKLEKELARKISVPKKADSEKRMGEIEKEISKVTDIRLIVHTQPKHTGIGKKKPEVFELALGGEVKDKLGYAKKLLGNEIFVNDIFKDGILIDVHAVTKGKGFQGPVKRFGVAIRQHKSEKTKRGPGALGPWHPHHSNYRVAHAGQMGYHSRMEMNKQIIQISSDAHTVNAKGGFPHYGNVKSSFVLLKGSIPGANKRLIKMLFAKRKNKKMPEEPMKIQMIIIASKQGK